MSFRLAIGALLLFVFVIVPLILFYEFSVWRHCLGENAWWYCLRLLG